MNRSLSCKANEELPLDKIANVYLLDGESCNEDGIANPFRMDRGIGEDVLTLSYNPKEAYNMEPPILLHDNIPPGERTPLQPFVGLGIISGLYSTSVSIVNNPRHVH